MKRLFRRNRTSIEKTDQKYLEAKAGNVTFAATSIG
jgi:hypothetical protein